MPKQRDVNLETWAKEWRETNVTPDVQRLINLASYDLYYGPACASDVADPPTDEFGNENEWSGFSFERACIAIKNALEDLPSVLYVEDGGDCWSESEPESEECENCDGTGKTAVSHCDHCGADTSTVCDTCDGEGRLDPGLEFFTKYERRELKRAIVGRELAEYV